MSVAGCAHQLLAFVKFFHLGLRVGLARSIQIIFNSIFHMRVLDKRSIIDKIVLGRLQFVMMILAYWFGHV